MNISASLDPALRPALAALLRRAGRAPDAPVWPMAGGGGNNRVFRVETVPPLLLKLYFRHPLDQRDRLGAEFAFLRYATGAAGLRTLPEPVAADPEHGLGLYGFIEGRRLRPDEIGVNQINQALTLVEALNDPVARPAAAGLSTGSEACFSLAAHLATVDRRLERLARIEETSPEHRRARALLIHDLAPLWQTLRAGTLAGAARLGLAVETELTADQRCVSPSDFGFHNALAGADGRLLFLDFEYAGWDDPAKLVGDFFSQVEVPVPEGFRPGFADRLAARARDPLRERARFDLLLPVYRVKWITILLNDFLPAGAHRRRFAHHGQDETARLAAQLTKALDGLGRLTDHPDVRP